MERLKNKNSIILILSAVLIVASVVIAVAAISADKNGSSKKPPESPNTESSQSLDLDSIILQNNTTEPQKQTVSVGRYKVAANGDPLNLRLGPDVKTDIITYVDSGSEVEVIAVWEDWGYIIHGSTGGWLSLNYLEPVGASEKNSTTTAAFAN